MKNQIIYWVIRIIPAFILLQTLFFKFTGAEESVYIFTQLGAEPFGRIGSGVIELIAGIAILIPRFSVWGAILSAGTMSGAIFSHLLILGIDIKDDGGQLFLYAVVTLICSLLIMFIERDKILNVIFKIK